MATENTQQKIALLTEALCVARDKLVIYRAHSNGEYQGGMEYTALMDLIDSALEA